MQKGKNMSVSGVCHYCGQLRMVDAPEGATQEEKDRLAAESCDCSGAAYERSKKEKYEKAQKNIQKLFSDMPEVADILDKASKQIAEDEIASVTVKSGKITAKASLTSKDKIKITRTEKNESNLES